LLAGNSACVVVVVVGKHSQTGGRTARGEILHSKPSPQDPTHFCVSSSNLHCGKVVVLVSFVEISGFLKKCYSDK